MYNYKSLALILILHVTNQLKAQFIEPNYKTKVWICLSGNCFDGEGVIADKTFKQHKIAGNFKNGLLEGKGKWVYETSFPVNNFVFEGDFSGGQRIKGKWIDNNGNSYDGGWKDGQMHGEGIQTTKTSVSKGVWVYGALIAGTYEEKNGLSIKIKGIANGMIEGTITYPNNDVYTGTIRDKMKEGTGSIKYTNLERYEGEWKYDNKHGKGVQYWPNGDRYEGQWGRNSRSGFGKMFWAKDSSQYEGQWLLDKPDGKGVFTFQKGGRVLGFDSGYYHRGIKISEDAASYESFKNGIRQKKEEEIAQFKKARDKHNEFLRSAFKVETYIANCVTYVVSKSSMNLFGGASKDSYVIMYQVNDQTSEATIEQIEKLAEADFIKRGTSGYAHTQKIINRGCSCQSIVKEIQKNYPPLETLRYEINYTAPIENK
jgi:hypothetical protein